jgi:hypothetical protein
MNQILNKVNSILLLFVFTISLFPNSFLHNHEKEDYHHHYNTSCEIDNDSLDIHKTCNHDSHFEIEEDECFWCDEYTSPLYYFSKNKTNYISLISKSVASKAENSYRFNPFDNLRNKSPPLFLS